MMVPQRHISSCQLDVSCIGLGTVKFGRNQGVKYPTGFELPSDQVILELLSLAQSQSINLIDTAPAYGESEQRLGQLLSSHERQQWVIASKAGEQFEHGQSCFDFSTQGIVRSVERSLARLNTDYLDIVLIHSDGRDQAIIEQDNALETLQKLKQQGKVRAIGMSTKTVEGGLLALEQSDVVMVTYNPVYQQERVVIDAAKEQGKGVLVKKALASGHLNQLPGENPVQAALEMILAHNGVSSIIIGTLNKLHLQQAIDAAIPV